MSSGLHPLFCVKCISHTPLAGYKGYGLSTMVDVLCGVMSGGRFNERIRKWTSPEEASLGRTSQSQEHIVTRKVCRRFV